VDRSPREAGGMVWVNWARGQPNSVVG
jgi:hypothetical protein